jgi:hypothetical protein
MAVFDIPDEPQRFRDPGNSFLPRKQLGRGNRPRRLGRHVCTLTDRGRCGKETAATRRRKPAAQAARLAKHFTHQDRHKAESQKRKTARYPFL